MGVLIKFPVSFIQIGFTQQAHMILIGPQYHQEI